MSHSSNFLRLVLSRLPILLLITVAVLLGACQVAAPTPQATAALNRTVSAPTPAPTPEPSATPTLEPLPTPTPIPAPAFLYLFLAPNLPPSDVASLQQTLDSAGALSDGRIIEIVSSPDQATATIRLVPAGDEARGIPLAQRTYALVAPFATVRDDISLDELEVRWLGQGEAPLYLVASAAADLAAAFGPPAAEIVPEDELLARLQNNREALALVPFDRLDPNYKVISVDGVNPLSKQFDASTDPLTVFLELTGEDAEIVAPVLAGVVSPTTNRDPDLITTLVMTGVTAMSRMTALKMERKGYDYPARVIGETLRAADITHVSNEVPFIEGCRVNASSNNLRFCSDTTYWEALEAIGTDIVGLSGNHVNDFGRKGAVESINFYRDNGIDIYGSGMNVEEACAPLLLEHDGNTFAFIAALAYYPRFAWATADSPGACYYYDNKAEILQTVQQLSQDVDIVAVELQHYETYRPSPTRRQIREFRELREAGADIVTGVQSHVPQAMEPYGSDDPGGPGIITYGLGNLFFDQMWSWQTRTGLIARHTIYDGHLLSTEILTTVLEDYAQPRWAAPNERARILTKIFRAAPAKPEVTTN